MPPLALRPRSATEIVDAAFQILKAHYLQFVLCTALAYTPLLVLQLLVLGVRGPVSTAVTGAGIALTIIMWLSFSLMSAVNIVCASQAFLGEPVDVGAAVRLTLPRLVRIMLTAALRYLAMMAGALLFLVGAFWVWTRYFAVTALVVLEDTSIGAAFSRSAQLSSGRKWHLFVSMLLVVVIFYALSLGLGLLALVFQLGYLAQAIVSAVVTVLVYPAVGIVEALLYYDARIKSEGLDIELMAGALDAPAPAPLSAS
jgi:hypothetical protein